MSIGIPVTKADIDQTSGQLARSLYHILANIQQFKSWLDGYSSQNLVDTFGYASTSECDVLKSAVADLANIAGIFEGNASTQTLPYDHTTFAKQLTGVRVI